MQVRVDANTENHVSVWLYLCKGEYDETLEWPFCADIEIELLNWREDGHHHRHLVHFNEATGRRRAWSSDEERKSINRKRHLYFHRPTLLSLTMHLPTHNT